MSDGYNGWTNYETWVCNLHVSNDEGMAEMVREWAEECVQAAIDKDQADIRHSASRNLETRIEELICEDMPEVLGVYADLLAASLGAINFREIAEHYVAEVELWSAGWNIPGFAPEETPSLFMTASDARYWIAEYLANSEPYKVGDATREIRCGSGELGVTVGDYHYFVMKV